MARPTKYKASYVQLVLWMSRAGRTDDEIAAELGIDVSTLYRWKTKYPEFCEAIKEGRQEPDYQVEQSLFRRAVGYEYEEAKVIAVDGKVQRIEKTKKQMASDVVACIFWLKNRLPDKWRDKHEIEGKLDIPLVIQRGDVQED